MNGHVLVKKIIIAGPRLQIAVVIIVAEARKITVRQLVLHKVPQNMRELRKIAVLILVPLVPLLLNVFREEGVLGAVTKLIQVLLLGLFQDVVTSINTVFLAGQPIQADWIPGRQEIRQQQIVLEVMPRIVLVMHQTYPR
ncbi:MAG: hypothetical protein COY68_02925 [Candidatus Levybacteria bacterium CG_4_10_14_0_8_um_filter_35_23]|nr:MAG: hypothetical protein COY68_02925 [Candidatus Levybacteria bacterium CG_4_10_14_0_8_um_filter_35_23]